MPLNIMKQIHYFYIFDNLFLFYLRVAMNFSDLTTFIAVAEQASFSKAAELLHITQPAVTKRVQMLENNLDCRLFDRVGKRVYLTEAGRTLMPQARHMLTCLQDVQRQLRNLSTHVAGPLHLATSHHIGLHRLAPVLRAFRRAYPEVQLNITFDDSEVAHEMVRQGDIELAVVTLNPAGDSVLHYTTTWHDPLRFVSDDTQRKSATLVELAEMPCVLPGTSTYTGRIVLETFATHGVDLQPAMSTNFLETIGMLVHVGLGWSVLPESMAGNLQIIEVEGVSIYRTLGCVTNPARALSNAAEAFLSILERHADPM
jgi:DNA-binding transcriptional LysR family regulator